MRPVARFRQLAFFAMALSVFSAWPDATPSAGERIRCEPTPDDPCKCVLPSEGAAKPPLPKESIREVIKMHLGEVRTCYERGLQRDRNLEGRVVVRFIITWCGAVRFSEVESSTLGDDEVASCVAQTVRSWWFPRVTEVGAKTLVEYPFVLRPAD